MSKWLYFWFLVIVGLQVYSIYLDWNEKDFIHHEFHVCPSCPKCLECPKCPVQKKLKLTPDQLKLKEWSDKFAE